MDCVNAPIAHHIGISYGGWIILKLASADSNRIASATLISSAGFANRDWKLLFRGLPAFFAHGIDRARRFAGMMSAPNFEPDELFVQMVDVMLNDFRFEREPKPVSNEEFSSLKSPTYLLMGAYEAGFNPQSAINRARAQLPNLVKYELMPGVGHGMIEEDVAGVNARILQFLKEHPIKM